MKELIFQHVRDLMKDKSIILNEETSLIGDSRVLDSLGLVELCLRLEDEASKFGFEFDWTSENAMSRSRSMFRTISALADEFQSQLNKRS